MYLNIISLEPTEDLTLLFATLWVLLYFYSVTAGKRGIRTELKPTTKDSQHSAVLVIILKKTFSILFAIIF